MDNKKTVSYMAVAAYELFREKNFKEREEIIEKLASEMYYQFDIKTESEAVDVARIIRTSNSDDEIKERLKEYYDFKNS